MARQGVRTIAAASLVLAAVVGCNKPSTGGPPGAATSGAEPVTPKVSANSVAAAAPSSGPSGEAAGVPGAAATDDTAGDSVPAPAAKSRKYVVAAMGDSLTDFKSHGGKYLEVLRERCPQSTFDSYGIGGNMVNQMRKRFAKDILNEPADPKAEKPRYSHVIVLGGINDICSDESALRTNDKIKRDLSAMYAAARDADMRVIAITLPPWGGFDRYYNRRRGESTQDMNTWIRGRVDAKEVDAVFDVYPMMSCGDPEFLCEKYGWPDKVHWSKTGHRVVGEALQKAVFADCQ
jgi:lysophospholipase L1-like esterase